MRRRHTLMAAMCCLTPLALSAPASAFCGFFVAKADTDLFNDASKVAMVRDGDRTVVTMASNYRGEASEFAMVIPVVDVPERDEIRVINQKIVDHLDSYTAPRLVEYHDPEPRCGVPFNAELYKSGGGALQNILITGARRQSGRELQVKIEAEYEVGEYDIQILSARESGGLITWLNQEGYTIPDGAEETVAAYLKRDMKFFVAKVALDRHDGEADLSPLQIEYEDENFMLPIRLGTVNAEGQQELFVFALSRKGRVETANYRTVKLPSDMDVPVYIKEEFGDFYKDMFRHQVKKEKGKAVFMEYAWDMNWCDPCAADPLSPSELASLGVNWVKKPQRIDRRTGDPLPFWKFWRLSDSYIDNSPAVDAYVTRLHVRYDATTFPEDLQFQETGDRTNYQGRYVLRHEWRGDFGACEAKREYANALVTRWDVEAKTLADITGRDISAIKATMIEKGYSDASLKSETIQTE